MTYDPSKERTPVTILVTREELKAVTEVLGRNLWPDTQGALSQLMHEYSRRWDPDMDENAECECGDPYYRHFDTYDDMSPVGCKYCECWTFKEKTS